MHLGFLYMIEMLFPLINAYIHTISVLVTVFRAIDGTVDCVPCLYQCCMHLALKRSNFFIKKICYGNSNLSTAEVYSCMYADMV